MQRLILLAALAVAPAFAQTRDALCEQKAKTARTLMGLRQDGAEVEKLMALVNKREDGPSKDEMRAMVLAAYEAQRWSSEEMRRRAVEDFGNEQYMACLKR